MQSRGSLCIQTPIRRIVFSTVDRAAPRLWLARLETRLHVKLLPLNRGANVCLSEAPASSHSGRE